MFQSKHKKFIVPAVALLIGFGAGATWAGGSNEAQAGAPAVVNDTDEMVAAAEANVARAQREYDRAMDDLNSPAPPSTYRPDPEMQMRERHIIELNEMICRETGQNCEMSRMARRQYNERYGAGRS